MKTAVTFFLGLCVIGFLAEVVDNVLAWKIGKEYKHTPEFQKLIDHYKEKDS